MTSDAGRTPRLSVVLPAYHEAPRIAATIERLRAALAPEVQGDELEVVVVDDGSTDDTADQARDAGAEIVVEHETNQGKGSAVRTGVLASTGHVVVFTDADLAYDPADVLGALQAVEAGAAVAIGSRHHAGTCTLVEPSRLRAVGGRLVNLATRAVLRGGYADTQSGLKAFSREAVNAIFPWLRIKRFAFDVEILFLAEHAGLGVVEVPVHVTNSKRSSVHVARDGLRLVVDLARIRWWAWCRRYPGPAEAN